MPTGIRATVAFPGSVCPVARLSASSGTTVESVTTNVPAAEGAADVTEFSTEDADVDGEFTEVFSQGSLDRYRLRHGDGLDCPCECLGRFECAPARYVAEDGTLTIVFYASDYGQLQAVVAALRERFPEVDIRRLVRSPGGDGGTDPVPVDRGRLTDRQLEALETAHGMGYFERPRGANATEVARELDIDPSTFGEHIATAQDKLLEDLLEGRG